MDQEKRPKRTRRAFSRDFKVEAVRLCRIGDRSIAKVAKDLGLTESSLRNWVNQVDVDGSGGGSGPLTTDEREELARLRRENKRLTMEREILKKATAFFVRENT
jgi:transposase